MSGIIMIAILFVFCTLFQTGLSGPTKRMQARQIHSNDRAVSAVTVSNPTTITMSEGNDSIHELENQPEAIDKAIKQPDWFGHRQNKLKDRSLVKIIRKSKTPRYKLRDSILQNDLFSSMVNDITNNSIQFQEIYSLGQTGRNENYILVNPKLQLPNITISNVPIPHNKEELVYTYLPVASLANGTEIELIKNTILRSSESITPTKIKKSDKNEKTASRRNVKHNVRKYFRLHSSVAKELEDKPYMHGEEHRSLPGTSGPSVHWPPASGPRNNKVHEVESPVEEVPHSPTQSPRMQSIILRWNLILI